MAEQSGPGWNASGGDVESRGAGEAWRRAFDRAARVARRGADLSTASCSWRRDRSRSCRRNLVLEMACCPASGGGPPGARELVLNAPFVIVFAIFFWHSSFLAGRYLHWTEIFEFSGRVLTLRGSFVPARGCAGVSLPELYGGRRPAWVSAADPQAPVSLLRTGRRPPAASRRASVRPAAARLAWVCSRATCCSLSPTSPRSSAASSPATTWNSTSTPRERSCIALPDDEVPGRARSSRS